MTRLKVVHSTLFALALALLMPAFLGTAIAAPPIPDGDTGALIDAINDATPGDTIKLAKNGIYVLTGSSISINKEITIEGRDATIDAAGLNQVFYVFGTGDLTLNNLTVTGGRNIEGGGIENRGTVTLNSSSVSYNEAISTANGGGGILNRGGTVTLNSSSVSHNTSMFSDGGGIASDGGTVTLNSSSVSHNTSTYDGGGIRNINGTVTLNDSIVSHNTSIFNGGGIINLNSGGTVTLNSSSVSHNTAGINGGGIYNELGTVTLNSSSSHHNAAANGGGIYNNNGTLVGVDEGDNVFANTPNDCVGC